MSDSPSEPPPPPPPPNLAPPPGYAAYQATPSATPLKRIGGLRTAILILLAVFAIGTVIQMVGIPGIVDSAGDLRDGLISEDEFQDDLQAYNLSGGLALASQIALIVLTMIWLFRVAKNHRSLGRQLTWAPGWAIGGWFLPPVLYVIPFLMLRESWKAADPDVPPGDQRWKSSSDTPLLWVWGVLYILVPAALIVAGLSQQFGAMSGSDADDLADFFDDRLGMLVAQGVFSILAAVSWALLVRALSDRHIRLTGEASGR